MIRILGVVQRSPVVTKDVPDYALMLGNPAEITGWMCECGHQLDFQGDIIACSECGREYRQSREGVTRLEKSFNLVL